MARSALLRQLGVAVCSLQLAQKAVRNCRLAVYERLVALGALEGVDLATATVDEFAGFACGLFATGDVPHISRDWVEGLNAKSLKGIRQPPDTR